MGTTRRTFIKILLGLGAIALPWTGWPERFGKRLENLVDQPAAQLSFPVDSDDVKIDSNCLQRTALDDINYLAKPELEGRRAGTSGEGLAADYLSGQLLGLGLEPMGEHGTFIQAFTIPAMTGVVANGRVTFRSTGREALRVPCANVCGGLRGDNQEEVIILSAHYDHVGIFQGKLYPGANDNASGVGCVLDIMRRLVREGQKPKRTVMAVFWSAEEMGYLGSTAFVQRPTVPLAQIPHSQVLNGAPPTMTGGGVSGGGT